MPAYELSGSTASVSCSAPSRFHMWPDVRIIAGIDASTMTSLGTWRLVMPLSESTIAMAGPSSKPFFTAASTSARSSAGSPSTALSTAPSPSLGDAPTEASEPAYVSKTSGKKARTTWPKMIGSETFIIVALRCTEKRTPSALARCDLLGEEVAQLRDVHERRVDDLAGEDGDRLLEHGRGAVGTDELDAQRVVGRR